MKYRPEIDGLRAVAVIPVIFFHAGFNWAQGGFVGVDIFFVISGFLITTLIAQEAEASRFSILDFYERRIRRILPALFFVCFCTIPFAWFWMLPEEFADYGGSLFSVAVFASNIWFFDKQDYFGRSAEEQPLLHTWSLSVEEQFYIFFPLLFVFLLKRGPKQLNYALGCLFLLSLAGAQWGWPNRPAANFYLLPTRGWELLIGSIVALYILENGLKERKANHLLSIIGAGLIVWSILFLDKEIRFPSFYTLIPTVGAAMIILFATPGTVTHRILSSKIAVFFGLLSYSAYLWHQPLFAFGRLRLLEPMQDHYLILMAIGSFILAWLTWKFVETPFRNKRFLSRHVVFAGSIIGVLGFFAVGFTFQQLDGLASRMPDKVAYFSAFENDMNPRRECIGSKKRIRTVEDACIYNGDNAKETWVIFGDSHAHALSFELSAKLKPQNIALLEFTLASCIPVPEMAKYYYKTDRCKKYAEEVIATIGNSPAITRVIVTSRWARYFEAAINKISQSKNSEQATQEVKQVFKAGINDILNTGKPITLVFAVPIMDWKVPSYLARKELHKAPSARPISIPHERYLDRNKTMLDAVRELSKQEQFTIVRPDELYCNTYFPEYCVGELDGVPLYFDADHMSSLGAKLLVQKIHETIQSKQTTMQRP